MSRRTAAEMTIQSKESVTSWKKVKKLRLCHLLQLTVQPGDLAGARVAVHNALSHGLHQLALSGGEGRLSRPWIAARDGLVELPQKRPDARTARFVHFGALGDFPDGFLGAGIVGHEDSTFGGSPSKRFGREIEKREAAV